MTTFTTAGSGSRCNTSMGWGGCSGASVVSGVGAATVLAGGCGGLFSGDAAAVGVCRRSLGGAGSLRLAACRRCRCRLDRAGFCVWPNGSRSLWGWPPVPRCVGSPASWVGRRPPSAGRSLVTATPGIIGTATGRSRRSCGPRSGPAGRSGRSWRPIRGCVPGCRIGSNSGGAGRDRLSAAGGLPRR